MTTPTVLTVWPAFGLTSPAPWMSAIAIVPGGPGSVPVPGSVPPSPGSPGSAGDAEFCGVIVALRLKSALLTSVSLNAVRLSDFTSVLADGAVALVPSNVFEVP